MARALFAGSFDPLTNGHLDTIQRTAPLFDHYYVAIATNSSKKSLLTFEEKKALILAELEEYPHLSVISLEEDLTVRKAKELRVDVLIRGVRNSVDYEYEADIAQMNKYLEADIETFLLIADPRLSYISSSLIKEVAQFGGDISEFVPPRVAQALQEKFNQ